MTPTFSNFFAMGGYAYYVWPAFAITGVILIWNLLVPLIRLWRWKK